MTTTKPVRYFAIIFTALIVFSVFAPFIPLVTDTTDGVTGTASAAATNDSARFYDGFENGTVGTSPANFSVVDSSADTFEVDNNTVNSGSKSLHGTESVSGRTVARPDEQPYSENITEPFRISVYIPTASESGGNTNIVNVLTLNRQGEVTDYTKQAAFVRINGDTPNGGAESFTINVQDNGTNTKVADNITAGEWYDVRIYNVDPDADTYSVEWDSASEYGNVHDIGMDGDMVEGYQTAEWEFGNDANMDDYEIGAGSVASHGVSGFVTDQNGDPVSDATVYATGIDTQKPPQINGTDFDALLDNPLPADWDSQLNESGFGKTEIDTDDVESQRAVLMHSKEQWDIHGIVEHGDLAVAPSAELNPPLTQIPVGDDPFFSCWELNPDTSTSLLTVEGSIEASLPNAHYSECDSITFDRLDPLGGVADTTNYTTFAVAREGRLLPPRKKEYRAAKPDLGTGVYRVYPKGNPDKATIYAVTPEDGGLDSLEVDLENQIGNVQDAKSKFHKEYQQLLENGDVQIKNVTTNSSGGYSIGMPNTVNRADVVAIDGGPGVTPHPSVTRDRVRQRISVVTQQNFEDLSGKTFSESEAGTKQFADACRKMESVANVAGTPFAGSTRGVDVPDSDVNISGQRGLLDALDPKVRDCYRLNLIEDINDDPLNVIPAWIGDLDSLTTDQIIEYAQMVLGLVNANPEIREQVDANVDNLPSEPSDINDRGTAVDVLKEGLGAIDSPTSDTPVGPGGGGGGGGGVDCPINAVCGGPDEETPDIDEDDIEETADRVNETISRTWPVTGVDDWDEAGVLIHVRYSNGTAKLLDRDSSYVEIDENAVGADKVILDEFPFNATGAPLAEVELDIATPKGIDRQKGRVRNPNFDGDIPGLASVRISNTAPGPSDSVTVAAAPRDDAVFGGVASVNVSGPDCSRSATAADNEASFETCGEGTHRIEVRFTNADGKQFREVLQVDAKPASQARPPAIRAATGPTGRYAVVGNGIERGTIEVTDGTKTVILSGVIPGDAEPPSRVVASTTGVDVARDASTTVRIQKGDTEQSIRDRVSVLLHVDPVNEDSLLYRNSRAIRNPGETETATVTHEDSSTTIDTYTGETAEVSIEVTRNPSLVEQTLHAVQLRFPSLPSVQTASVRDTGLDVVLGFVFLVVGRRRPPRPSVDAPTGAMEAAG